MHLLEKRFHNSLLLLAGVYVCLSVQLLGSPPTVSEESLKWYVTAKSGLVLRATPSQAGEKITIIPFGQYVTLLQKNEEVVAIGQAKGNWSKVSYQGKTGWLFDYFLVAWIPPTEKKLRGNFADKSKNVSLRLNDDFTFSLQGNVCDWQGLTKGQWELIYPSLTGDTSFHIKISAIKQREITRQVIFEYEVLIDGLLLPNHDRENHESCDATHLELSRIK